MFSGFVHDGHGQKKKSTKDASYHERKKMLSKSNIFYLIFLPSYTLYTHTFIRFKISSNIYTQHTKMEEHHSVISHVKASVLDFVLDENV